MQNLKTKWSVVWKITWNIWQIFTRELEGLKFGTLIGFFSPKLKIYELKIYRGDLSHENEKRYKIWKGIDLSVQNWHEELNKFWLECSKPSKICTLMGCVGLNYIMFELRKYREGIFDSTEY